MPSPASPFLQPVREHMDAQLAVVPPTASCAEVVGHMIRARASVVVVDDGRHRCAGVVTEQDVVRRVAGHDPADFVVTRVMSSPVQVARCDEPLYEAVARMRRHGVRHMPVVDALGHLCGMLHLERALAAVGGPLLERMERLSGGESLTALRERRAAQAGVVAELLDDAVPTGSVQALLARVDNEICARVVSLCLAEMRRAGLGEPPVGFDVIVMGSAGRGESMLNPDQDNGFVLADYPDDAHTRIDRWFTELAERTTQALERVGFATCRGHVMATNPVWRKSLSQWRKQVAGWVARPGVHATRLCDIFFDFAPVYGDGKLAASLRASVTGTAARPAFLREMWYADDDHDVALGWFGRLRTDENAGPSHDAVDLKTAGTLPLVGAVRLLALRERVTETGTRERLARLRALGLVTHDEHDALGGALDHIARLLLATQAGQLLAERPPSSYVLPATLTGREREMLVQGLRAIRAFRRRVRGLLA